MLFEEQTFGGNVGFSKPDNNIIIAWHFPTTLRVSILSLTYIGETSRY
jgi:hypothetical protein